MRALPYLPSVVLIAWALFTATVGDEFDPLWRMLLGLSLVVMAWSLSRRYQRDGRRAGRSRRV